MYLPESTAFFDGQSAANNGASSPVEPSIHASYEEKMYFRGFMQQQRKLTKLSEVQVSRRDMFSLDS